MSPQFHVQFDNSFHTAREDKLESQWQNKAGFLIQRENTNNKATSKRKREDKIEHQLSIPPLLHANMQHDQIDHPAEVHKDSLTNQEGALERPMATTTPMGTPSPLPTPVVTRSGRNVKPVKRLIHAMKTEISSDTRGNIECEILCLRVMYPQMPVQEYESPLQSLQSNRCSGQHVPTSGNAATG